ncbi:hypothetical protein [Prochlorococcus marinus]|uniref:hypothetical protein n=1 Tax=Prochlorococcus marinus TaxID=1219 RepID=UPI0001900A20|nr:hypothetical protein [Prochlorococcus marinus]EEE40181.1 hypothetical protein P9202_956 [Prochlorococcus marinus str. MIT 9202]
MDFSTAAWFSLLAFIILVVFNNLPFYSKLDQQELELNKKYPFSEDRKLTPEEYKNYVKEITPIDKKRRIIHITGLLGIFCAFVMVLQGIHLWSNWDGLNSSALDKALMKSIFRARRGGIIALVIQFGIKFFPQFLIAGYDYLIYESRYYLTNQWEYCRDGWIDQYR